MEVLPRTSRVGDHGRAPADEVTLERALDELIAIGDPRVIPHLVWLLDDAAACRDAARAISALVPSSPVSIADLAVEMHESIEPRMHAWRTSPADLVRRAGIDVPTLGVLSWLPSGYVREQAVRALANNFDGRELPYLLLRANDWVAPVATRALTAVIERLRNEYSEHFAHALAVVARMRTYARRNHSQLMATIAELLHRSPGLIARELGADRPREQRRAAATLLTPGDQHVVAAVADPDPIVALRAYEVVVRSENDEDRTLALEHVVLHPAAFVRRRALEGGPELAKRLLFDANGWNRELARQRLGGNHVATYRAALSDAARLVPALLGLMDVGDATDVERIRPLLAAPSTPVAIAALDATCKLDPGGAAAAVMTALSSSRTRLARAAWRHVQYGRVRLLTSTLEALAQDGKPATRTRALGMLHTQDRWAALVCALMVPLDADPALVRAASRVLAWWEHLPTSLYAKPTIEQRRAIDALSATTPSRVAQTLRIVLRE